MIVLGWPKTALSTQFHKECSLTGCLPIPALRVPRLLVLAQRQHFGRQSCLPVIKLKKATPFLRVSENHSLSLCACLCVLFVSNLHTHTVQTISSFIFSIHNNQTWTPDFILFFKGKRNHQQCHSVSNEFGPCFPFTGVVNPHEIGRIFSRWIIILHSDALQAAYTSQGPMFLGSKHIRVWTPVMPTLQPQWYYASTSSHNPNVRLVHGGWIINAVSFGLVYFTKQNRKKVSFPHCLWPNTELAWHHIQLLRGWFVAQRAPLPNHHIRFSTGKTNLCRDKTKTELLRAQNRREISMCFENIDAFETKSHH